MTEPLKDREPETPTPVAGGCLIAAGCVIGTLVGMKYHQSSLGILVGVGVGVVLAVLIWLRERGR
jgi:UDP-N-acetylmuramyl pentapeptide phosphotransferase/UDP-N-acetylglucosamine-1-phosphate transferase